MAVLASIGQGIKNTCIATSRLAALPGQAVGYLSGRAVGAAAGAVIVGAAKLSNTLFKTEFKPKSINEYSKIAAQTSERVGGLASKVVIAAATAPLLGVPIILGTVFDYVNQAKGVEFIPQLPRFTVNEGLTTSEEPRQLFIEEDHFMMSNESLEQSLILSDEKQKVNGSTV